MTKLDPHRFRRVPNTGMLAGDGLPSCPEPPYSCFEYYSTPSSHLVCQAHQALVQNYRTREIERIDWYWQKAQASGPEPKHRQERVGPFIVHSGPLISLPLPIVSVGIDSQVKTYMDRDALGDSVRKDSPAGEEAIRIAREGEVAKRIGGANLQVVNLLMVAVEYNGYIVGGMMINPGRADKSVGAIMQSPPPRATSIAALQAEYRLAPEDPFLAKQESELVDLIRYFRLPDPVLKQVLPGSLAQRSSYRPAAHLIRALTISEAFAATERWMESEGRRITIGLCETPTRDVKSLVEGRRFTDRDGRERRIDAIPHRILTSGNGVELYPDAYANRPEGKTKLYTLYAFDFGEIALRSREYRAAALDLFREGM